MNKIYVILYIKKSFISIFSKIVDYEDTPLKWCVSCQTHVLDINTRRKHNDEVSNSKNIC